MTVDPQLKQGVGQQLYWHISLSGNSATPEEQQETALNILHALYSRIGEDDNAILPLLNHGADAAVYWMKKDRKKVIKITRDAPDAWALEMFRRKPSKDVVKVYDVFQIFPTHRRSTLYGIVEQKLTPLHNALDVVASYDYVKDYGVRWLGEDTDYGDIVKLLEEDRAFYENEGNHKEADFIEQKVLPFAHQMERWNNELHKRGIVFKDLHEGNVMMNGRRMVLMDLGRSQVQSVKLPLLDVPRRT